MKPHKTKGRSLLTVFVCCCAILALCIGVRGGAQTSDEVKPEAIGLTPVPVSAQEKARKADGEDARKADSESARKADGEGARKAAGEGAREAANGGANKVEGKAAEKNRSDAAVTEAPASSSASSVTQGADDRSVEVPILSQASQSTDKAAATDADKTVTLGSDKTTEPVDLTSIVLEDEPIYTIPDDAAYVPGEVLVTVDEGMDGTQLAARIKEGGAKAVDPDSAYWLTDDTVRLNVTQGFTVEDAVNELLLTGVTKGAQPDFVYYAEDMAPEQAISDALGEDEPMVELSEPAQDEAAGLELVEKDSEAGDVEAEGEDDGLVDEVADDEPGEQGIKELAEDAVTSADATNKVENALPTAQNDAVSNDPYSIFQWSLPSINAPQVWNLAKTSPLSKVGVAVIDCGFDVNHEDLRNMIAPGSSYNAYRASEDITDPELLADVSSGSASGVGGKFDHGMHVAGIIAAERDNGVGIAGVTNNVQLVPIRAYNYDEEDMGATTSSLIKSFEYVIENKTKYNIRVINSSIGVTWHSAIAADDKICAEIDKAFAKGIVTVCSGGNAGEFGPYINYPSDWATAVSVINLQNDTYNVDASAVGESNNSTGATWSSPTAVSRRMSSNYNAPGEMTKNISAPGSDILSTTDKATTMLLGKEGLYMFDSGTSMAAPHVAGVLAMMFGKAEVDASYDGAQYMVDKLYESARHIKEDVPFELEYGHGEVDALAAWNALDNPFVDGPAYVAVGQADIAYAISSKSAYASEATSGWSFSSSDAGVLEVDAATGACTPKAVGTAEVMASKDGRTLSKCVTVFGPIMGYDAVMANKTAKYNIEQKPAMAWEWSVSGDATITNSGVLVAGPTASKLTLSATLVVAKGTDKGLTLTKDVYVLGAPKGDVSVQVGGTATVSLEIPEGFDGSGDALVWGSEDTGVATVADGVVTGVGYGLTVIWVAPKEAAIIDENGKVTLFDDMCHTVAVKVTDSIERDDIKVVSIADRTYTGSAQTPKPVLTRDGATLVEGEDYTLGYADNVNAGSATITVNGVGKYEGTSRKVTFKIVQAKIPSATAAAVTTRAYTGKAIQPKPKLTFGGKTLKLGTDYTLAYKNNTVVGTATIVVTGKGNFKGTKNVTFKIAQANISSATAAAITTRAYTGKAIQPKPKLTFGGKTLKLDTDYTLAYKSNTKAGTATIVVTGKGNFKGTKNVTFKIVAPSVTYRSYVQGDAWQSWVKNGAISGTTGQSKRVEGLRIKLTSLPVSGGITYCAHMQGVGWQDWRSDGATAGLAGKGKRLEAVKIKLTGELAKKYDVRYRVHCQRVGWTQWVKNGAVAGTTGRSLRAEAIEIKVVPK